MKTNFGTPNILSRREEEAFLGICLATLDHLDIPRTRVRRRVMFKREVLNKNGLTTILKSEGETVDYEKTKVMIAKLIANADGLQYGYTLLFSNRLTV